ncbi:MAG: hypothetical protein ACM3PB_00005, partial [Betaproteobacteria bacterium]
MITGHNITVVAADTNKVVDVIYLNKEYLDGVAVSPDYTKLYVLYSAHANPELSDMGGYDESYYIFLLTIDLYNKQIVADTWYIGGYFDLIYGTASNLVISPDGRYLYFASNTGDGAMIFQYDTTLNAYTRGIEAENVQDITLGSDGKRLYYADGELDLLYVLDLPGLTVSGYFTTIDVDMTPMAIAVNDQQYRLYVAGSVSGTTDDAVTSIDGASYDLAQKTGETTMLFSAYVKKIRLGPGGQRLFVIEPSDQQVIAYDVNQPWDCWFFGMDARPWDIKFSADGTKLYTWCPGKSMIFVHDVQTRQQVSGSPVRVGPEKPGVDENGNFLVMGPVPQGDVFVNDSAYRAHQLQAIHSVVTPISNARYAGILLSNKSSKTGGSSFYRDPGTGSYVFFNMSGTATATPTPKPASSIPLPKVTVIPFPGLSGATTVPQENQSQTVTPQPGNETGTPTPGAGTGATPTPTSKPSGSGIPPKVTVMPFPGLPVATAGPQENQSSTATPPAGD